MSLRTDLGRLEARAWENDTVRFKPMKTEEDLIYANYYCKLTEEQQEMVNPAWFSIGRAYLFPEDNYPCIIMKSDGEMIGFVNLCRWLGDGDAYSWSFFIDKDAQGKGYGTKSAELAVNILKAANRDMDIKLAVEKSNIKAQRLYKSLGFMQTPEMDEDDLIFGIRRK